MDRPSCATCPYWESCGEDEGGVRMGRCVIRSPSIIPEDYMAAKKEGYSSDESLRFASCFPVLYYSDCCAEHPDFPAWIESRKATHLPQETAKKQADS